MSWASLAGSLAFLLAGLALPGLAVQRLLGLAPDPALALPLGYAFTAAAYGLALTTGLPALGPLLLAALVVGTLAWRRPVSLPSIGRGAVPGLIAVTLLIAVTRFPVNRVAGNGDFLLETLDPEDTTFHVGLTWELAHGMPPEVPGLAGFDIRYHFGPHLVRAAAWRWAGVHPYDAVTRLDPLAGALALALLFHALVRRMKLSAGAAALAPLTLLATNFSFVAALAPRGRWWTDLFGGDLLIALVFGNAVVIALALALGAVLALWRYTEGEGSGWLWISALLAAAVPLFKIFTGVQLLLALAVACTRPGRRRAVLTVMAVLAVSLLLLWLYADRGLVMAVFDPVNTFVHTRRRLGLAPFHGLVLLVWAAVWLIVSLGGRVVAIPEALRAAASGAPAVSTLGAFALAGWPLALLFRVSPREPVPGLDAFDTYFAVQSGAVLWLFVVAALARMQGRRRRLVAALVAALAAPATIEFVARKAALTVPRVPAAVLQAAQELAARTAPGEVVMANPSGRWPPPAMVFVGRRVPATDFFPFLPQYAPQEAVAQRREVVQRFFTTPDASEAAAIAASLSTRYLFLLDGESVAFPPEARLRLVAERPGARVYLIEPPPSGP